MADTAKAQRKRKPGRPPKAATGATAMNDLPARDDRHVSRHVVDPPL